MVVVIILGGFESCVILASGIDVESWVVLEGTTGTVYICMENIDSCVLVISICSN